MTLCNKLIPRWHMAVTAVLIAFGTNPVLAQISIPTVPIGNPGNAGDPNTSSGAGAVAYSYEVGSTEVTNGQYAAFLNAVAATDTNGLYNPSMAESFGGITREGVAGSYTYGTISGREHHPVNYVSFWDACRFANWLHNGQPVGEQNSGTTEDGAYTLTPASITNNTVARNANWRWAVPSHYEWYKAAFHQPSSMGGSPTDYWAYPTSSNSVPTADQANFGNVIGNTTPVGSYPANFYGTFDMGGNVWEWFEDILFHGFHRGLRGGAFDETVGSLWFRPYVTTGPANEFNNRGFRVCKTLAPPACPADYNGIGDAGDILDFLDFIQDFSDCTNLPAPCGQFGDADVNGNTLVDILDFLDFIEAFSEGC